MESLSKVEKRKIFIATWSRRVHPAAGWSPRCAAALLLLRCYLTVSSCLRHRSVLIRRRLSLAAAAWIYFIRGDCHIVAICLLVADRARSMSDPPFSRYILLLSSLWPPPLPQYVTLGVPFCSVAITMYFCFVISMSVVLRSIVYAAGAYTSKHGGKHKHHRLVRKCIDLQSNPQCTVAPFLAQIGQNLKGDYPTLLDVHRNLNENEQKCRHFQI